MGIEDFRQELDGNIEKRKETTEQKETLAEQIKDYEKAIKALEDASAENCEIINDFMEAKKVELQSKQIETSQEHQEKSEKESELIKSIEEKKQKVETEIETVTSKKEKIEQIAQESDIDVSNTISGIDAKLQELNEELNKANSDLEEAKAKL